MFTAVLLQGVGRISNARIWIFHKKITLDILKYIGSPSTSFWMFYGRTVQSEPCRLKVKHLDQGRNLRKTIFICWKEGNEKKEIQPGIRRDLKNVILCSWALRHWPNMLFLSTFLSRTPTPSDGEHDFLSHLCHLLGTTKNPSAKDRTAVVSRKYNTIKKWNVISEMNRALSSYV